MRRTCECGFCPLYYYKGQWLTLRQLSKLSGIKVDTLRNRIETNGWPVATAVETPKVKPRGYHPGVFKEACA